jgi:hydroxymethylglutaryl-CoA lyase
MKLKLKLRLYDVTMRDGLQDIDYIYTYDEKCHLLDKIIENAPYIKDFEIGSFPNLKFVPQMANTDLLFEYSMNKYNKNNQNNINFYVLIFNNYGYNKCVENNISNISFITSYCETFIKKNINKTSDESVEFISRVLLNDPFITSSKVYLSAFCGSYSTIYEKNKLIYFIKMLISLNVKNITLSDTYSLLTPQLFKTICNDINDFLKIDSSIFSLHIHKNVYYEDIINIALDYNIYNFDVSQVNGGKCAMIKGENIGENLHINDIKKYV